ncbi:hypothetical protein chiPu_0033818, partial [Chiloscyllium punctatum]|nr:hypothetical protein [Chiloscyllium punctatum]
AIGVAAVVEDDAARPQAQRVVEVGDRDVVLALVVIGRAAQIVDGSAGLEAQRLGRVRNHLRVVALLVPADRTPEMNGRELLTGKHLQRDDLGTGVDHLIGGRCVGRTERAELGVRLCDTGRRRQHGSKQAGDQEQAAHRLSQRGEPSR